MSVHFSRPLLLGAIAFLIISQACTVVIRNPWAVTDTPYIQNTPNLEATVSAQLTLEAPTYMPVIPTPRLLEPTREQQITPTTAIQPMPLTTSEADQTASPTPGIPSQFVTITDASGYIQIDVPIDWTDVDTGMAYYTVKEGTVVIDKINAPSIQASVDLKRFNRMYSDLTEETKYYSPGIRFSVSDKLAARYGVINFLDLRDNYPDDAELRKCRKEPNPDGKPYFEDYDDIEIGNIPVDSAYSLWKNCGAFGGPWVVVFVAKPKNISPNILWLVEIQTPRGIDREEVKNLMERIIKSIRILRNF